MTETNVLTPQDFLKREIAEWGEDEVYAWIEAGWSIVPNGVNGFRWDLTRAEGSATLKPSP